MTRSGIITVTWTRYRYSWGYNERFHFEMYKLLFWHWYWLWGCSLESWTTRGWNCTKTWGTIQSTLVALSNADGHRTSGRALERMAKTILGTQDCPRDLGRASDPFDQRIRTTSKGAFTPKVTDLNFFLSFSASHPRQGCVDRPARCQCSSSHGSLPGSADAYRRRANTAH